MLYQTIDSAFFFFVFLAFGIDIGFFDNYIIINSICYYWYILSIYRPYNNTVKYHFCLLEYDFDSSFASLSLSSYQKVIVSLKVIALICHRLLTILLYSSLVIIYLRHLLIICQICLIESIAKSYMTDSTRTVFFE